MTEEKSNLKDEIKKLREVFEKASTDENTKKFKLPLKARMGKSKVKRNYAGIAYINENLEVQFFKLPIKEGGIIFEGQPHLATPEYTLTHKGKPFLIITAWSVKPFNARAHLKETIDKNEATYGHRLLLNLMKSEILQLKKKLSATAMIIGLVVLVSIGYVLTRNGGING